MAHSRSDSPVAFVEGVEACVQAVAENDCLPANSVGDGGVLALRIAGHVDAASEWQRAGVERLRQGGFARAHDPGEDEVGGGDDPAGVEHPGVVDEGAAGVEVLADEDAVSAEAAFGDERVRPRQRRRRVLMAWEAEPARGAQRGRPGLTGSRQVSGGFAFGAFRVGLRSRRSLIGAVLLGSQCCGSPAALFAQSVTLGGRSHQDGCV